MSAYTETLKARRELNAAVDAAMLARPGRFKTRAQAISFVYRQQPQLREAMVEAANPSKSRREIGHER